jgi:hypothetical protein
VPDALLRTESTVEFFKAQVEAACDRQQVAVQPLTSYYVVTLLSDCTRVDASAGDAVISREPLAIKLARALQSGGSSQRHGLRQVGDASLLISGFFSDSIRRTLVDIDYYASIGGYAYGSLGATDDVLSPIFAELADKFIALVDVLTEVSERSSLSTHTDVLRLYEKWVRTGSRRNGELLAEHGIVPNESIIVGSKRVH